MRISLFLNIFTFIFFEICSINPAMSQPEYNSKKKIEGIHIYQDKADPFLFYYEPGDLILNTNDNGEPDFQFLDMRYTGTKCYNDAGEKSFMSLVQFGVMMKKASPETLQKIKATLKSRRSITLKPLPVSYINTRLVLPVNGNNDKNYEIVEDEGVIEAIDEGGYSSSNSFWTKRTFTVKLNKHESQLLNEQLTKDLLGLSLSYSYYSNVIMPDESFVTGSKELLDHFKNDSIKDDENQLQSKLIKSNTLSINIDIKKYPKAIKQIDLNEEIPPTYAAIEVKCYDFLENLRPDLYMKIVEVEASTVDNSKITTVETKFLKKHAELYTQYLRFPYAVQMNVPVRYRIIEISQSGDRTVSEWKNKPECSSVIDITSTSDQQKIVPKQIDIEINGDLLSSENISKIEVHLVYSLHSKVQVDKVIFDDMSEIPLKSIKLQHDKGAPLFYVIKKITIDGETNTSNEKELTDNYLFITS